MIGFVVAAAAAVFDWWSVATGRAGVERFAKPLVMVGLAAVVVAERPAQWGWLLAALLASLVGDVLLLPSIDRFVPGLTAFLVAHLAYTAAFLGPFSLPFALGLVVLAVAVGSRIVRGASERSQPLGTAVGVYIGVLTVMASFASGWGGLVLLGAMVFAASDAVLGWNRFVGAIPHGRLITHVLYHVGQALIVAGFVSG